MTDLEPCPFCGNRTLRVTRADLAAADLYEVWCRDCGARGPVEKRAEAIRLWNARKQKEPKK